MRYGRGPTLGTHAHTHQGQMTRSLRKQGYTKDSNTATRKGVHNKWRLGQRASRKIEDTLPPQ